MCKLGKVVIILYSFIMWIKSPIRCMVIRMISDLQEHLNILPKFTNKLPMTKSHKTFLVLFFLDLSLVFVMLVCFFHVSLFLPPLEIYEQIISVKNAMIPVKP